MAMGRQISLMPAFKEERFSQIKFGIEKVQGRFGKVKY
jgi:hypothetical protein